MDPAQRARTHTTSNTEAPEATIHQRTSSPSAGYITIWYTRERSAEQNYMQSYKTDMVTTTHEFELLVERRNTGTPPGMGWATFETECPQCSQIIFSQHMIGTTGIKCSCGYGNPKFVWYPPRTNIGGDLCYLSPIGYKRARINHN